MATFPDQLDTARHRDAPRGDSVWVRRAFLLLFLLIVLLGLANSFGQSPAVSTAAGPAATLRVSAPDRLRGGLLFGARFDIRARRAIKTPTLVLADGWLEDMQFNTSEPSPASEDARHGRLILSYPSLAAGDRLSVWLAFQVDPTSIGRRPQTVTLRDGTQLITRVKRTVTIFP